MQLKYDDDDCNEFVRDMEAANHRVHHVVRADWSGPVIEVHDLAEALFLPICTDVRMVRERLSTGGYLVRPVASGRPVTE